MDTPSIFDVPHQAYLERYDWQLANKIKSSRNTFHSMSNLEIYELYTEVLHVYHDDKPRMLFEFLIDELETWGRDVFLNIQSRFQQQGATYENIKMLSVLYDYKIDEQIKPWYTTIDVANMLANWIDQDTIPEAIKTSFEPKKAMDSYSVLWRTLHYQLAHTNNQYRDTSLELLTSACIQFACTHEDISFLQKEVDPDQYWKIVRPDCILREWYLENIFGSNNRFQQFIELLAKHQKISTADMALQYVVEGLCRLAGESVKDQHTGCVNASYILSYYGFEDWFPMLKTYLQQRCPQLGTFISHINVKTEDELLNHLDLGIQSPEYPKKDFLETLSSGNPLIHAIWNASHHMPDPLPLEETTHGIIM